MAEKDGHHDDKTEIAAGGAATSSSRNTQCISQIHHGKALHYHKIISAFILLPIDSL